MDKEKRVKVWVQRFPDRENLVLQWHDPKTGRRRSESAGTADEKEAEHRRGDKESDLNNGRHRESPRMSWETFRELFEEEYYPGVRQNTRTNFKAALDHFEAICKPGPLNGITTRTLSAFVAGLRGQPGKRKGQKMHATTVQVRLISLKTMLRWAHAQGLLTELPKFPKVKLPGKKPQTVPSEDFEKLLAATDDPKVKAYLLCGWLAGLRLEEAYLLEWDRTDNAPWLDLGGDQITLPAEFVKGDRDQWIPLDPLLKRTLLELPRQGERVFNFRKKSGEPIRSGSMTKKVVRLASKAGVSLTMRSLRRGFGCRYASKVPAQVLQKLMRHSNIKVTMDYYANVDDAVRRAVREQEGGSDVP